jgi:cation-transporting P-type ATPase E
LTLAASLTIGIPTFFLALAPGTCPWKPERFVRGVARFAVPAGAVLGAGLVAGYLFGALVPCGHPLPAAPPPSHGGAS